MTSFVLKIIAMITMFIDHVGYVIFGKLSYFNYIGRIAFPIFAFQISEGYLHTSNLKKYLFRIGLFAIISQIPYALFLSLYSSDFSLNIFFTLFLGLFAIALYDKMPNKLIALIPVIAICYLAKVIHVDYGTFGVAIIFIFYLFKDSKILMNISYILLVFLKYLNNFINYNFRPVDIYLFLGTLSALIFINLYNGKQGKKIKYILYIFYPLHLLILYFIALFMN